jgi:hypothetical protein
MARTVSVIVFLMLLFVALGTWGGSRDIQGGVGAALLVILLIA